MNKLQLRDSVFNKAINYIGKFPNHFQIPTNLELEPNLFLKIGFNMATTWKIN